MNIVEAYIKFRGQLIIVISGISGCGKTSVAKFVSKNFKIRHIEQFNYYKKDYDKKITLPDGTTFVNYYSDDAIDWDLFNSDINLYKDKGVVISGFSFPKDSVDAEIDYHIHLSMSKIKCMEKRRKFLEKHKDIYKEEFSTIGTPTEKLQMNQIIYPYYIESKDKMKINKFININEMSNTEIVDTVWDSLIEFIQSYIDWFNKNRYEQWKQESQNK